MAWKLGAILCLGVIFAINFDSVSADEEVPSNLGVDFKLLISKMEQLQDQIAKQQLEIIKLNKQIAYDGNHRETNLDVKFKNLEEVILKRMDSMKAGQDRFEKSVEGKLNQLSDKIVQLQTDNEQSKLLTMLNNLTETVHHHFSKLSRDTKLLKYASPPLHSCQDARIKTSGSYWIKPFFGEDHFETYCELDKFGGTWQVIQHRFNGSVDFFRGWEDYRAGFGDPRGEFFTGLETIHRLTKTKRHMLLIEVESFAGQYGYALYDRFEIGSEEEQFSLKELGRYTGSDGDSLRVHEGMKFSTKDRDNDSWKDGSCANDEKGAWWYAACGLSNLNGPYINQSAAGSIYWNNNKYEGLKMTRLMIKEF